LSLPFFCFNKVSLIAPRRAPPNTEFRSFYEHGDLTYTPDPQDQYKIEHILEFDQQPQSTHGKS
jgi:hypothetical protein